MTFQKIRHALFTVHMWIGLILGVILAATGASSGEPTMPFYLGSAALFVVAATIFVAQRRAYGKTRVTGTPDA